jgi:hypothetical protein
MKYLFILFAAATLVSCNNADQKATTKSTTDSAALATTTDAANFTQLTWVDSTFQDLGKVNEGQVVDIVWHLKNTGNKPLVIGNVTPGCGCTVAEKPTEPIAPGEEGLIKAKFDSKNQTAGEHRKNITVTANTKEQAYYLTFNVNVVK